MRIKATLIAALACLSACEGPEKDAATETAPATSDQGLSAVFVSTAPVDAQNVSEVFADPKPGREVVVSGEVMGSMNPLVEGRAMMVLGDPTKITPCNRIEGDSCPTPWDVCCDDPEVIKKSIATIQVLGEDGRPLKEGLESVNGLEKLSFVTVKGTIAEGSNPQNLLINAKAIHVAKTSPFAKVMKVQ